MNKSCS